MPVRSLLGMLWRAGVLTGRIRVVGRLRRVLLWVGVRGPPVPGWGGLAAGVPVHTGAVVGGRLWCGAGSLVATVASTRGGVGGAARRSSPLRSARYRVAVAVAQNPSEVVPGVVVGAVGGRVTVAGRWSHGASIMNGSDVRINPGDEFAVEPVVSARRVNADTLNPMSDETMGLIAGVLAVVAALIVFSMVRAAAQGHLTRESGFGLVTPAVKKTDATWAAGHTDGHRLPRRTAVRAGRRLGRHLHLLPRHRRRPHRRT